MQQNLAETVASPSHQPVQPARKPGRILPGSVIGGELGTFSVDFTLWSADRTVSRSLNGLVDTGASYTMVPAAILEELGVAREWESAFELADGSRRSYSVGLAPMELAGQTARVHTIFGPDDAEPLIGALALEVFALAVDARQRRLIPAQLTL